MNFRYLEVERGFDVETFSETGEAIFLLKDAIISPEFRASCHFSN